MLNAVCTERIMPIHITYDKYALQGFTKNIFPIFLDLKILIVRVVG